MIEVATSPDGSDARVPRVTLLTPEIVASRRRSPLANQAEFDPNTTFSVSFDVRHPGTEAFSNHITVCAYDNQKASTMTLPAYMDALLAETAAASRDVRLTGLRGAARLNGREGVFLRVAPGRAL